MTFLYTSHFMTLDGVVTDPEIWHPRFVSDESMTRLLDEMAATWNAAAVLYGLYLEIPQLSK